MSKRLYRSRTHRLLGGVAGGLAEYIDVDVVLVRLIWGLLALAGGSGLLAYIIAWVVIPEEPRRISASGGGGRTAAGDAPADEGAASASGETVEPEASPDSQGRRGGPRDGGSERPARLLGVVLILVGAYLLARLFLPWIGIPHYLRQLFWPGLLIVVGFILLIRAAGRR